MTQIDFDEYDQMVQREAVQAAGKPGGARNSPATKLYFDIVGVVSDMKALDLTRINPALSPICPPAVCRKRSGML